MTTKTSKINVTKTYLPDKKKYLKYVDKIYDNNWITNQGRLVCELTEKLSEFLGVKNIILVSNGTSALEVSYRILGLTGKVITTPFSFVATTSSLVSNGLSPVFSDIDSKTFNICPNALLENIHGDESAIVATHVFGNACEIDTISRISRDKKLKVIYDAAHCFSVDYKNSSILNFGDISTISFHATKLFHTIEGGAICVNDASLVEETKHRINFGIDNIDSVKYLGTNAKMNEFEAAMGLCILEDIGFILEQREEIHNHYIKELQGWVQLQSKNPDSTNNFSYFPILLENVEQSNKVLQCLTSNYIFPRKYFSPSLDLLPYLKHDQIMHVSRDISSRILCLPVYPGLHVSDRIRIINIIKEAVL